MAGEIVEEEDLAGFRFRLTVGCRSPGLFRFDDKSASLSLGDNIEVELTARDADVLEKARKVHFDGHSFPCEKSAREAGERLRSRLRIVNAMLGLGLDIPAAESVTGGTSDAVKEKMAREHGAVLLDNVWGLAVFPDDGRHVEIVSSVQVDVYPSDPNYLLRAIADSWCLDFDLSSDAEDALNILGMATGETSERAAFLTTYLALESVVPRRQRSAAARDLLKNLQEHVRGSDLTAREVDSLVGSLSMLREESFRSALMELVSRISEPPEINGVSLKRFLSECVKVRNDIAHRAELRPGTDLQKLSSELRKFVLSLIWNLNKLPRFSVDVPPSRVVIQEGGFALRAF